MKLLLLTFVTAYFCGGTAGWFEEKPLKRTFIGESREAYHVQLDLKADVRTFLTSTVGAKTYVTPIRYSATGTAEWNSTRIVRGSGQNVAKIEEALSSFSANCEDRRNESGEAERLQRSLADVCLALQRDKNFEYVEGADGHIEPNRSGGPILLGESGIPLLALWLQRALRPSAIFPALPFHTGARLQKPISGSSDAHGSETAEWLDAPDSSNATLHVVQELSWVDPPFADGDETRRALPAGKTSFFADSSTQISLLDGSIVTSTRTASRETKRVLDRVEGLPQAPEFSTKITAAIVIRRIS